MSNSSLPLHRALPRSLAPCPSLFLLLIAPKVFAPTDAAFETAGFTTKSIASLSKSVVTNLVLFHLLEGAADATVVAEAEAFYTMLKVRTNSGSLTGYYSLLHAKPMASREQHSLRP